MNKSVITKGAGLIIGITAYMLVRMFLFGTPGIDKQNAQIANELNKTCPMMIDSETRLDNLLALPENTLAYNYTLINYVVDSIDVGALEDAIKPTMIETISTHPDLKFQRDNKTTLSYNYRDRNGTHVLQFKIGPEDYFK